MLGSGFRKSPLVGHSVDWTLGKPGRNVGKTGCTLAPGGQEDLPEVLTFEPRMRWYVTWGGWVRKLDKGHSRYQGPEVESS